MSANARLTFSHIGIHVHDIARVERFYVGMLGFFVTDRGGLIRSGRSIQLVFLSRDPREHHQIALVSGRPMPLGFNVVNQLSLRADSLGTLREFYQVFTRAGVEGIDPITHLNAVSLYASDPEGNRIELFWDTPWHVPQPVAIPIDLNGTDSELMAWMETEARSRAGYLTKSDWIQAMSRRMSLE